MSGSEKLQFKSLDHTAACWLGLQEVAIWSSEPGLRVVAVVSSRLPRQTARLRNWAARLADVLDSLSSQSAVLICQSCAGHPLLQRACELRGIPTLRLLLPEYSNESTDNFGRLSFSTWKRAGMPLFQMDPSGKGASSVIPSVIVAGPQTGSSDQRAGQRLRAVPIHDRAMFALADEIRVVDMRANGNVCRLVQAFRNEKCWQGVPLITASREFSAATPAALSRCGPGSESTGCDQNWSGGNLTEKNPLSDPQDWLIHWTRECRGAWPDESQQDYFDAVLTGAAGDRSGFGALRRILSQGIVRGSSLAIRGGHRVVSLTAVPLGEFRERRVYRRHRQRFDFEPWGLAFRKSALRKLGAAPVHYASETEWKNLADDQQPWYQKHIRTSSLDAVAEKEWRLCGDLSLCDFAARDLIIFTNLPGEAADLQREFGYTALCVPMTDDAR